MKKQIQRLTALLLTLALAFSALPTAALGVDTTSSLPTRIPAVSQDKTLRILAVGNSFSLDSLYYLYYMAKSAGYDVIIGNLYHSKFTLQEHFNNFDKPEYKYFKISPETDDTWVPSEGKSIQDAVKDEAWDLITLQQASAQSGLPESYYSDDWTCTVGESATIKGEKPAQPDPDQPTQPNPDPAQPTQPSQPDPDPDPEVTPEEPDTDGDASAPEEPTENTETDENTSTEAGGGEEDKSGEDASTPEQTEESETKPDTVPPVIEAEGTAQTEPQPQTSASTGAAQKRQEQTVTCGLVSSAKVSSISLQAQAKTPLTYQSSDEQVATVDEHGRVTFRGTGKVVITVTAAQSDTYYGARCQVTFSNTRSNRITQLQEKVKSVDSNPEVRFGWNITWAYADGKEEKGVKCANIRSTFRQNYITNYSGRQDTMYQAIVDTVRSTVQATGGFSVYIPTGTAIQNLRSSYVGDTLNLDGVHLNYNLGRYVAAMTWAAALGIDLNQVTYRPAGSNAVSPLDLDAVRESVTHALEHPLEVTKSAYTTAPALANTTKCTLTNAADGVKLTWKRTPYATGYKIWRKTGTVNGGGSYTLVKEITDGNATSYTDKAVKDKNGVTYTYSIRAVSGNHIAPADQRRTIKRLGAAAVSASNTADGIKLTWKKVTSASGYRIYRGDENGKETVLKTVKSKVLTYTDKSVKSKNGSTYTYTVQPYSGETVGADDSEKKVVRLTGVSLRKVVKSGAALKLTWSRNSKAQGYYVYRKSNGSNWAKVKSIPQNTTLTYTDKAVKRGRTYYYKVYAYKDGSLSQGSNTRGIKR